MQTDHHPPLLPPAYPAQPGKQQPDLNLAGISTPGTDLSGGNFTDATPPQRTTVPPFPPADDPQRDLHLLGIDPEVPYFELNLAGSALPVPRPASLAAQTAVPASQSPEARASAPTFGTPNYAVPSLRPYDLAEPGIDAIAPLQPDPQTGDLLQFARPLGLHVYAASDAPLLPDPMAPDLDEYDRPAGLEMPGARSVDPALPDLQDPTLEQDVHMPDRPADLAPGALDVMHDDASYQQVGDTPYREVYMDAHGMNTTRRRHMDLLMRGLDEEER
jgi:hypothetical protein